MRPAIPGLLLFVTAACGSTGTGTNQADDVIDRGFAYLHAEVSSWQRDNACYSCHHNGDAARAIYLRRRLRQDRADPIPDTSTWLRRPAGWGQEDSAAPFRDRHLARLQFASALCALDRATPNRESALLRAARALAADQAPNGAWQGTGTGNLGSPITYGPNLATAVARRVLLHTDAAAHTDRVAAAGAWLHRAPVRNVVEACGVLLGLADADDALARTRRQVGLDLLARAQDDTGGFGPYVNAAPEVFDTALVVVALAAVWPDERGARLMPRAVAWLRANQEPDGGWLETTRPAGQESYAHRVSTTAWALQALLLADHCTRNGTRTVVF